jgi:hypothetical protein
MIKNYDNYIGNFKPMLKALNIKRLCTVRMIEGVQKLSHEHIQSYINKGFVLNDTWDILGKKNERGYIIGIHMNKTEAKFANYLLDNEL